MAVITRPNGGGSWLGAAVIPAGYRLPGWLPRDVNDPVAARSGGRRATGSPFYRAGRAQRYTPGPQGATRPLAWKAAWVSGMSPAQ